MNGIYTLSRDLFVDRQGNRIDQMVYGALHEDRAYCIIAQEYMANGVVSTVWTGFAPASGMFVMFSAPFETIWFNQYGDSMCKHLHMTESEAMGYHILHAAMTRAQNLQLMPGE